MVGGFDNRARAETGVLNRPRILLVSLCWRKVCIFALVQLHVACGPSWWRSRLTRCMKKMRNSIHERTRLEDQANVHIHANSGGRVAKLQLAGLWRRLPRSRRSVAREWRIRHREPFGVDGSKSGRKLSRLQFLRAVRHHHSAVWEQHGRSGEWFVLRSLRRPRTRDARLAPDIYRSGARIVGRALVQSLRQ